MKNHNIPTIYRSDTFENLHGIHITVKSFQDYELHRHDFYEFEYVIDGEGECEINGKSFLFRKGDLSFVTPLDIHGYKSENLFETVTVHFQMDNLSKELIGLTEQKACIINCTEEMKQTFMRLAEEKEAEDLKYFAWKNLLERIVVLFLRCNNGNFKTDMSKEIIYAVGYINQNFTKKLSLTVMCEKIGYSQAHFCRQFKKFTGMSFVDYLTDVRVAHAKNLLIHKDLTITQLCYECGFSSLRNFNRAFQKKYGCSPKQYKYQNLS